MKNLILSGLLVAFAWQGYGQTLDKSTLGGLNVRQIGPATMSGRIAALDALDEDPRILYVGAAGGGVWKSTNAGTTFEPVFDDHTQSIGAIRIDQKHPDTVWVGTGEIWTRNSVSVGTGIYKTTSGGRRWKQMGLEATERIGDIIIHPEDPNTVFVAALGHLWGPNAERGVYKTTDGGTTWSKVLFVDENTGCAELAMDPENPNVLYASMWDFRRRAYDFRSGGPGSGIYRSTDGGETWEKYAPEGLPKGTLGRISLAFSPANPDRMWTLIECDSTALFRSDDRGLSWKEVNRTDPVALRPFYFSQLYPDPTNEDIIYKPGYSLTISKDGGESFASSSASVHPDMHAFYVGPKDPEFLYVGTDGGVYKSYNQGGNWEMMQNLPVSTFYHVSVDQAKPYNVYGGLQDNGSWVGPSSSPGGILNGDWKNVGGGDGFYVFPDPKNNELVYWQSQGGNINRHNRRTGEDKNIRPFAPTADPLRFNWNTPVYFNHNGQRMYVGAQYLFVSSDQGNSWSRISDDLTTNDPEKLKQEQSGGLTIDNSTAENHCTIITIGESPLDKLEIWVGTDDGNLQLTRNGGKKWAQLAGRLPNVPANTWVSSVAPSRFKEGTCYVTLDGHRNDDMRPYVFKTTDWGRTWTALGTSDIDGYCHVIREDSKNANLLYLGTEKGLYVSIDGGKQWVPLGGNMPPVSIRDLALQEREGDLVMATHGRGIFILDDLTPLRAFTSEIAESEVAFLPSRPGVIRQPLFVQAYQGDDGFAGPNPSSNATITYYLKKRHIFGSFTVEILNKDGEVISEVPSTKRKGLNRIEWVTRRKPPKVPRSNSLARGAIFGPSYAPGTYTVRITKGDEVYEGEVTLIYDPDSPHSLADREAQRAAVDRCYTLMERLVNVTAQMRVLKEDMAQRQQEATGTLKADLQQQVEDLQARLDELVERSEGRGISGQSRVRDQLATLYGSISRYGGRPTATQLDELEATALKLSEAEEDFANLVTTIAQLNEQLEAASLQPLKLLSPEQALIRLGEN